MTHAAESRPDDTLELRICPDCGAAVGRELLKCWLCGREHPAEASLPRGFVEAEVIRPGGSGKLELTLSSILILVALAVVNVGVWMIEPGAGLMMTLIVLPAAIATMVRAARRRGKGQQLSWLDRTLTFFLSALVSFAILGLLAGAAFVAFFIYCLVAISQGGF